MSDVGIAVGETVPDVQQSLVQPDGETETASLSELVEEQPVLLNFYTVDFSPDCISEWCEFRDFDWFASGDAVQVVGASKSGERLHRKFISQFDLGFPLFADTTLELADAFGVRYKAFGLSHRAHRSCFLVDEEMTVRYKWIGEHWMDPTRDTPPVSEIHEAIVDELTIDQTETFGF
ncbi:peroxiredoxin [Halogeometricum borinquense DSM 11551]|uniref:thioredoxin-dependent peroxiredoxin n=2 Tax=Halogeometricum borinquense TaxID=60847 RepID=E4NT89_HALBP|nr:peroxiredoxin family protein [Halogeometricum borinquense]ADQ68186.1 Peroxiredoxin [Halogeometricum borinquense DSM 11551]ELY24770.1 peroxiredoxin [Halogeometricum borinquense DSM 11551]RYJ12916.1 peroxiredoxin family protein [Halogeometricum borinquense]